MAAGRVLPPRAEPRSLRTPRLESPSPSTMFTNTAASGPCEARMDLNPGAAGGEPCVKSVGLKQANENVNWGDALYCTWVGKIWTQEL